MYGVAQDVSPGTPFVLTHVHDEAHFRLRSHDKAVTSDARIQMPAGKGILTRARRSRKHRISESRGPRFSPPFFISGAPLGGGGAWQGPPGKPRKKPFWVGQRLRGFRSFVRRGCSIQNHVVHAHFGQFSQHWFTELVPLRSKTAVSIATSIVDVVEELLETISIGARSSPLTFVHLVTGDGTNTNPASLRRVLAHFLVSYKHKQLLRYRLVAWTCGSHTANLCTEFAVAQGKHGPALQATCVRVFKYLIPQYVDQQAINLKDIAAKLTIVPGSPLRVEDRPDYPLFLLYGEDVLPVRLRKILNVSMGSMTHVTDAATPHPVLKGLLYTALYEDLLVVEEKPTTSRFWLFASACWTLLKMKILGLDVKFLRPTSTKPQKTNSKRLDRVTSWWENPENDAHLRVTCVCLRVTMIAVNITAQKPKGQDQDISDAGEDRSAPTLVRLGRKEVQRKTRAMLLSLLPSLKGDEKLDANVALLSLVSTQLHIEERFAEFQNYPGCLWRMTKKWNGDDASPFAEAFLEVPVDKLDMGYSVPLQMRAKEAGDLAARLEFLMSDEIQGELERIFACSEATSLDGERKHSRDKSLCKKDRVTSVARGSRNSILQVLQAERARKLADDHRARRQQGRLLTMNAPALARQDRPDLAQRPRGRLHWEGDVSKHEQRQIVHAGDPQAFAELLRDGQADYAQRAEMLRSIAKKSRAADATFPVSTNDWIRLIEERAEWWQGLLATATRERRQRCGQKLIPRLDLPEAERVAPVPQKLPKWAAAVRPGVGALMPPPPPPPPPSPLPCSSSASSSSSTSSSPPPSSPSPPSPTVPGCFCALSGPDAATTFVLAVRVGVRVAALELDVLGDTTLFLDLETCWDNVIPAANVSCPDRDLQVYSLSVECSVRGSRLVVKVLRHEHVDLDRPAAPRKRKAAEAASGSDDDSTVAQKLRAEKLAI
ncbi:unnamed protein product [Prorocentrum cordatum]|uniref:Uncharacterized protein n=1 Tax=Prorocentrum cordatum TaxID=2364126 RepID=A0ABN9S8Z5_9DINO|nr:unnamed protein product [Polarella glacialis]